MFKRRKVDRRAGARRDDSGLEPRRRGADRRQGERRKFIRLAYPIASGPEIMNIRSQVVGLTAKAVRFFVSDLCPQKSSLQQGGKINITLKFHDGEVFKTAATILRQDQYQPEREYFVCFFDDELSQERIEKEKEYLLEKFPEFCKDGFD